MTRSEPPGFLAHYSAVLEAEAARRAHQPEFAATLREWAQKARDKSAPAQGDLFAAMKEAG